MTDFEVGVPETSATESIDTSTVVSRWYARRHAVAPLRDEVDELARGEAEYHDVVGVQEHDAIPVVNAEVRHRSRVY